MTGITYNGELLVNYSLRHGKLYGPSGKELAVTTGGKVRITIKGERKSASLEDIINENNVPKRKAGKRQKKQLDSKNVPEALKPLIEHVQNVNHNFTGIMTPEESRPSIELEQNLNYDFIGERDRLAGESMAKAADKELVEFMEGGQSKYMEVVRALQKELSDKGVCNSDFLTQGLLKRKSVNANLYDRGDELLGTNIVNFNLSAAAIAFCAQRNISAVILSNTPESDRRIALSIAAIKSFHSIDERTLIYSIPLEDDIGPLVEGLKILNGGVPMNSIRDKVNTFHTVPTSHESALSRDRGSHHEYQFISGLDQMDYADIVLAGDTFKTHNKDIKSSSRIILGDLPNVGPKLEEALNDYRSITFESLLDFSDKALTKITESKELIVLKITNEEKLVEFESKLEWYTDSPHIHTVPVIVSGLDEFPGGWAEVVVKDMNKDELPESMRTDTAYKSYLTRHILEVLTTGPIFSRSKLCATIQDTLFAIFAMNNVAAIQSLLENDFTLREKYERLLSDVIALFCDNIELLSTLHIGTFVSDFIGGTGIDPIKLVRALQIKNLVAVYIERKAKEAALAESDK